MKRCKDHKLYVIRIIVFPLIEERFDTVSLEDAKSGGIYEKNHQQTTIHISRWIKLNSETEEQFFETVSKNWRDGKQ